jgi:hypothetical protein
MKELKRLKNLLIKRRRELKRKQQNMKNISKLLKKKTHLKSIKKEKELKKNLLQN